MNRQAVIDTINRIHNRYRKGTIEGIDFSDTLVSINGGVLQTIGGKVRVRVWVTQNAGKDSWRRFRLHCGRYGRRYVRYAGQTRRVLTHGEFYGYE